MAEDLARKENKECISAFIWACFPNSLITFTKKGVVVKNCLYFDGLLNLPLLYVEKKAEYAAKKDYFHSEEYLNARNMLLA